ncbi:radical SAM/SPASM domain-containing protein [Marinilabilia salmonicolor]|uniref:Radical SAM protein with 4Fe4S-binding SPASM domain n=1 Tax=Marinilabilia salmonicolor TaxID=989 RepID=A0A368UIY0_9BACT|nr:radical SAM protein [Marinilabilia salmonicolor]RCW23450.1 radical SAM protein with 4Fe4S-binding SPASM domain [Marinilabilia salmonicolor]
MVGSEIVHKQFKEHNYSIFFNKSNGCFIRLEDKGYPEVFWSPDAPELLDVSITNRCTMQCEFCYRCSSPEGIDISLDDYKRIVDEASKLGVLQIALGGGNPNEHPDFIDILKYTHDKGIVVSYTSNGLGLSKEILKATEEFCGAMAISAYAPYEILKNAILSIKEFDIKTNIHYILKKDTVSDAIEWLVSPPGFLDYINAIVFLNYKPSIEGLDLSLNDERDILRFFDSVNNKKHPVKIGFDSCSISGVIKYIKTNEAFIEPCEASRFSAFINESLEMFPCSFMSNSNNCGDLRVNSIQDIWQGNVHFKNMRSKIENNNCKTCSYENLCLGGCNYFNNIELCGLK